jgi:signal transduction histidine kinase/DNA-binding NarL/FixJ family response regulator
MKTSEHDRASPQAGVPELVGVDPRVLVARQIRLYIETAPVFHFLMVGAAVGVAAGALSLYVPEQRSTILLWTLAIAATLLVRLVAWIAYSRDPPDDDAVRGWLKWFVAPHALSMAIIGSAPLLLVPSTSAHEGEILLTISALVYAFAPASALKLSAYRPTVLIVLGPMVLLYVATMLRFPGIAPKLMALGGVVASLWGHGMATTFNRSIVRAMELSIRNENLVSALEARGARLREQTEVAEGAQRLAEDAERAKTRFLAAASHDLRQPLHALNLFVAQMRTETDPAERSRVTGQIDAAVTAMNDLFDALLDISRLDAGALAPELTTFPIAHLMKHVEATFAPAAREKGLRLQFAPSDAWVRSDFILLQRILLNLVSNAIRYTVRGGVVAGCRRRGRELRIEIWDSGIGIPEDQQESIFREFYQVADAQRSRREGLGLGLTIVERLCRLLDHRLELTSTPGRGSRFAVSLPLVAAPQEPIEHSIAPKAMADPVSGKLIVVIDDDALALDATRGLLRRWGCFVVAAESESTALASLSGDDHRPDLIISDYRLADGRTGIEAIQRLRSALRARIPAFLVTGDIAPERLREASANGFHLLHKPLEPMALRAMLNQILRGGSKAADPPQTTAPSGSATNPQAAASPSPTHPPR